MNTDYTGQHICGNCYVICVEESGRWVHPEQWRIMKARYVCDQPQPLRPATAQEAKRGAMRLIRRDRWMREEQLQQLVVPEGSRIEVAIAGCYQHHSTALEHPRGWGYLASDGHFGFGATTTSRRFDGHGKLAAPARALFWALLKLVPEYQVTVLTDLSEIADLVNAWRSGDVTAAPPGYDRDARPSGRKAKLMYLAPRIHQHAELVAVRIVDNYEESTLGKGAKELSELGWKWSAGDLTTNSLRETAKPHFHERALAIASGALGVEAVLVPRREALPGEEEFGYDDDPETEDDILFVSPSGSESIPNGSPASRGRRELLINGRRVRLSDLISAGLLQPGAELTYQHRIGEIPHRATVTASGQLRLSDGREFNTPSGAAATAARVRAVPGWAVWQVQPGGQTLHQLRVKLLKDVADEVAADDEEPQEETEAARRRFAALEEARAEAEAGRPRALTVREFIRHWGVDDRDRAVNLQIDADLANHGLTTVPDFRAVSLDKTVRMVLLPEDSSSGAGPVGSDDHTKPTPSDVDEESIDIGLTLGNLLPDDASLVWVSPKASFEEAITAMQVDDFSQIAVLASPYTLHGVVTWESIAAAKHRNPAASFSDAIDLRARDRVFNYDVRLLDVLEILQQDGFIFVRDDQRKITGIITATDVVRKYDETATPFFLIGEIDQELRLLVHNTFEEETVRQACTAAKIAFESFDSMTIGQYQAVLDNPDCWKLLEWPLDRKTFIKRLDHLRQVRNKVMHFNPDPVRPVEVRKLRNFLRLIRQYSG